MNTTEKQQSAAGGNERLLRILQASEEQLAMIDRVLAGELPVAAKPATGPLLIGMGPAAVLLGVSRATLWRIIKAGRLAKVEVLPASFRVRRSDVEALAQGGAK